MLGVLGCGVQGQSFPLNLQMAPYPFLELMKSVSINLELIFGLFGFVFSLKINMDKSTLVDVNINLDHLGRFFYGLLME